MLNHPRFQSRTILIEKDGPPVFLACDSKLLRRAFQNLISNALIHNPYPAQVRIQIQSTDREVFVQIRIPATVSRSKKLADCSSGITEVRIRWITKEAASG